MKLKFAVALAITIRFSIAAQASPPSVAIHLTIHEWGTFTVLQDEHGRAIGGVNTDDEPVPAFVHGVNDGLIQPQSDAPPVYFKGVPQCDPSIYVRLETPVIYFHAPRGYDRAIDLNVAFRGGWLTQYYPDAQVNAPGLTGGDYKPGMLTDTTIGGLTWHNLRLGGDGSGPQTNDPVWLSPRRVNASPVRAEGGEREKFIFYRGVGHINTPLSVSRTADSKHFELHSDFASQSQSSQLIGPLWLIDVRRDGKIATRSIARLALSGSQPAPQIDANFTSDQYNSDLTMLRRSMHEALVTSGLYDDEADALLNTWEVSYFRRPGLRLFYLVPPEWTEQVLPLKLSRTGHPRELVDADVKRVMVGRVELVTPVQRQQLAQIARGPVSDPKWLTEALRDLGADRNQSYREDWLKALMDGKKRLSALPVQVPLDYRAYLDLGRFRNALILDEASRRPYLDRTAFTYTPDPFHHVGNLVGVDSAIRTNEPTLLTPQHQHQFAFGDVNSNNHSRRIERLEDLLEFLGAQAPRRVNLTLHRG